MRTFKELIKSENAKIGQGTLIFSMSSEKNCAAGKAGECDLWGKGVKGCYAAKAEIQYKNNVPQFRDECEARWDVTDAFTAAEAFISKIKSSRKEIKAIRFNESGDFKTSECIDKVVHIAEMVGQLYPKIKIYTYTHRESLFSHLAKLVIPKNLNINISDRKLAGFNSFIVDKEIRVKKGKGFKGALGYIAVRNQLKEKHKTNLICLGDCSVCTLCKFTHGKEIICPAH